MIYVISYLIALVTFVAIDATWLTTMGAKLYRETLGDILTPEVRLAPAVAFYLIYPIGLVIFGVNPALRSGSAATAIVSGALFSFFAYATYDLTNYATLRNWTLNIVIIDIAYGAAVGAVVSAIAYALAPVITRWFGA